MLTAVVGTLLATPGVPPLDALIFGNLGIALAAASAAAVNHVLDSHIDARMATHAPTSAADGAHDPQPRARIRARAGRRIDDAAGRVRQRPDRGADVLLADPVRGRLHRVAQARHAAEHRDRRCRGRGSAGARLDRGDQSRRCARAAAVHDHLRLDAAALLGARHRAPQRLRPGATSRCCRSRTAWSSRGCTCCSTP